MLRGHRSPFLFGSKLFLFSKLSFFTSFLPPNAFSGKMRKFSKLFLAVLTVVSFVFFLFYKIQYDKLYNVLQVLEFFGDAEKAAVDQK